MALDFGTSQCYQRADEATMLEVVLSGGKIASGDPTNDV
jgi:hypothetical protein